MRTFHRLTIVAAAFFVSHAAAIQTDSIATSPLVECIEKSLANREGTIEAQREKALLRADKYRRRLLNQTQGPTALVLTAPMHGGFSITELTAEKTEKIMQAPFVESILLARTEPNGQLPADTHWLYGSGIDFGIYTPPYTTPFSLAPDAVTAAKNTVLQSIYDAYAKQGPERRDEIGSYKRDDSVGALGTTHFITFVSSKSFFRAPYPWEQRGFLSQIEPLFHAQIQVSSDPDTLLNTERHSGRIVERKAGEIWGDLGRVFNPPAKERPTTLSLGADDVLPRNMRFKQGVQTALSWFLHSANGDHLVFQTNDNVFRMFQKIMGSENMSNATPMHVNGHEALEWKIIMNRDDMLKAERRMVKLSILDRLNQSLKSAQAGPRRNTATLLSVWFQPLPFEQDVYAEILRKNRADQLLPYGVQKYFAEKRMDWQHAPKTPEWTRPSRGKSIEELKLRLEKELGLTN